MFSIELDVVPQNVLMSWDCWRLRVLACYSLLIMMVFMTILIF